MQKARNLLISKNAKKPLGHITKILIKNQTHNKHFQDKKINDKKED